MESYQTRISRHLRPLKKRLHDNYMNRIGLDLELFALSIENNSHDDEVKIDLTNTKKILGFIKYPEDEIPISNSYNNNNNSMSFHMYDILPIEFYCKWEDKIKISDIIIQKIIMPDDSVKAMILQVVDLIARADTDFMFAKYIVAPYTFNLKNTSHMEIKNEIEKYLKEPVIVNSTIELTANLTPEPDEY